MTKHKNNDNVDIDALEHEVFAERICRREREVSDGRYAPIHVKTIVYGAVTMILVGFMSFLLIKVGWK